MKVLAQRNQDHIPYSVAYKVVCIDDRFIDYEWRRRTISIK